jgi:ABC-2 type transport system permease protein
MIRAVLAIVIHDLKRAWLDRARLIAGLVQPLLYLFVLGAGIGAGSRMGGGDYRRFIFPGTMGLCLLFSATFSAITIVFDRQIGFFKAVLVAPVPRPAIAIGKIIAGALQALSQGVILLPFAPLAGVSLGPLETVEMLAAMLVAALTFSTIGVSMASRFTSTAVFPIISNAVLLPMFFLSGALYRLRDAPTWMQYAAHFDPVAYAVGLLTWAAVRVFERGEDDSALGAARFNWRR